MTEPKCAISKLETQGSWWCGSSLNVNRLNLQEEPVSQSEPEDKKKLISGLKEIKQDELPPAPGRVSLLFCLGLQLFGYSPPISRCVSYFTQSTNSSGTLKNGTSELTCKTETEQQT